MTPRAPFWFVCGCLALPVLVTSSVTTIPAEPQLGESVKAAVERQEPRVDRYGDPLPPGAIARLGTTRFRQGNSVWALAYSPNGKYLATANGDPTIGPWDVATGRPIRQFANGTDYNRAVVFSSDGNLLAAGGDDGTLGVWEVASAKRLGPFTGVTAKWGKLRQAHDGRVITLAFSPDGTKLVSGSYDDLAVRMWEVASGKQLREIFVGLVTALAFSPDGTLLAAGIDEDDKTVFRVWDAATGKDRYAVPQSSSKKPLRVQGLGFAPDGRTLATVGDGDGAVHLWDAASGRHCGQ